MEDGSFQLVAIVILIFLSAVFSATETAFSTFNRVRMKNLAADGNRRAELVMRLAGDYDGILTTILIGNNIVNIGLASIATLIFTGWFPTNGAAISTAVTTVVVLIFGEVSPKSMAKESPDGYTMFIAPFIRAVMLLFTPLNLLFRYWKKLLSRIFRLRGDSAITEEELITIVDEAEQDGGINEREGDLIRSAIGFDDLEAADIITPRVEVTAVDISAAPGEIAKIFSETGFSRLPVYDETVDNVIGILHEKDFYHSGRDGASDIKSILRRALFVPCHIKVPKLLAMFQREKAHMAIVLDDYGGTMGIATLEDVLEELVGDIWDEHDEVVELIKPRSDGSIAISGSAKPADMFEYFGIKTPDIDDLPQTVNGWVMRALGELPEKDVCFESAGLSVVITKTGERLAEEITVRPAVSSEAAAEGGTAIS